MIAKAVKKFAPEKDMRGRVVSLGLDPNDQSMREASDLLRYIFHMDENGIHLQDLSPLNMASLGNSFLLRVPFKTFVD